ncbi:sulfotransferase domain-containing protein [bacterium]|nr:sulfotransferase domain-containing protein [bacterium]
MDLLTLIKRSLIALNVPEPTRVRMRETFMRLRDKDPRPKIDPDFLLIGAQKGGTSSVFLNMMQHPNIIPPLHKEIFFFNEKYEKGFRWYRNRFAPVSVKKKREASLGTTCVTGEATITYLCDEEVPARVKKHYPDIRLMVILRNPVLRAHSHFKHAIRIKNESRDFLTAIKTELARLEKGILEYDDPEVPYIENTQYIVRGRYAPQLENWFNHFPREQLLVLRSEDFFEQPAEVFRQINAHLEIPQWQPETFQSINIAPNKVPFGEEERQLLADYFRPYNQQLNDLMGRDFGWD